MCKNLLINKFIVNRFLIIFGLTKIYEVIDSIFFIVKFDRITNSEFKIHFFMTVTNQVVIPSFALRKYEKSIKNI